MKATMSQILASEQEQRRARMAAKLPEWASVQGLEFPSAIALEQCSSSATAMYKASLLGDVSSVADLCGGLGVDSWAFSRVAGRVLHNEMNAVLSAAVQHNFALLGVSNVSFSQIEINAATLPGLASFAPELIYLDPARRDAAGRKVFLPEQCSPDVVGLRDELLALAPTVLVKLSPMADIPMLASRFGAVLSEVHIVEVEGECKEILCRLERGHDGPYPLRLVSLPQSCTLDLDPVRERSAAPLFPLSPECLTGMTLFEPSAALAKSGCFNTLSARWGMTKLGRSTQLYSGEVPQELLPFGKRFVIREVLPLRSSTLRAIGKRLGRAEISARNIPMSSEQLRSRLGVASGGEIHVFGVSVDASRDPGRYLLLTGRL